MNEKPKCFFCGNEHGKVLVKIPGHRTDRTDRTECEPVGNVHVCTDCRTSVVKYQKRKSILNIYVALESKMNKWVNQHKDKLSIIKVFDFTKEVQRSGNWKLCTIPKSDSEKQTDRLWAKYFKENPPESLGIKVTIDKIENFNPNETIQTQNQLELIYAVKID